MRYIFPDEALEKLKQKMSQLQLTSDWKLDLFLARCPGCGRAVLIFTLKSERLRLTATDILLHVDEMGFFRGIDERWINFITKEVPEVIKLLKQHGHYIPKSSRLPEGFIFMGDIGAMHVLTEIQFLELLKLLSQ
jgi:hypothetical protein